MKQATETKHLTRLHPTSKNTRQHLTQRRKERREALTEFGNLGLMTDRAVVSSWESGLEGSLEVEAGVCARRLRIGVREGGGICCDFIFLKKQLFSDDVTTNGKEKVKKKWIESKYEKRKWSAEPGTEQNLH